MTDAWLRGWKMIAEYLSCSIRTAKRYHWEYGMPIRRAPRNTPIGLKGEIDEWLTRGDNKRRKRSE